MGLLRSPADLFLSYTVLLGARSSLAKDVYFLVQIKTDLSAQNYAVMLPLKLNMHISLV